MNLKKKFIFISKNNNYINCLYKGYFKRRSGRNFSGKKTLRFRGFLNKKKKRIVDYFRSFWNLKAIILNYNYDPKRNTLLNLLLYFNGLFSYVVSFENSFIGMSLRNGFDVLPIKGYCLTIKNIPKFSKIHCIESKIKRGAKFIRSSGGFARLITKMNGYAYIKLSSKKVIKINLFCIATIGSVLNFDFNLNKYKKAGFSRMKGFKSHVRGVAMNPIDHPHGGGEGKKSKLKNPKSPWGFALNLIWYYC